MSNVKMVAVDTLHISSIRQQSFAAGEEFEVSADDAKSLEKRGLARRVEKAAETPANKADAPPKNKATAAKRKSA